MTYVSQSSARGAESTAPECFAGPALEEERSLRYSDVQEIVSGGTSAQVELLGTAPRSETAVLVNAALDRLKSGVTTPFQLEHHTIVLVVRGCERLTVGDSHYALHGGDVAWLPAGSSGHEQPDGTPPVDRLIISYDRFESHTDGVFSTRDTAGRLREVGAWLVSERRATFEGSELYLECALGLLLAELARLRDDVCSVIERQTRSYVQDNMQRGITLHELAANVGMSRHYFCRTYHRLTGESPMTTVRNLRLERARQLITTTNLSLREIAGQVGFSSQYHLSRVIRTYFGVGMKELRASARRSSPK